MGRPRSTPGRRPVAVPLLALAATAAAAEPTTPAVSAPHLELQLADSGAYALRLNGEAWLHSAPTTVRVGGKNFSTADGSLAPASSQPPPHPTPASAAGRCS